MTTIAWLVAAFISTPTENAVLIRFYNLIKPHPFGWKRIIALGQKDGQIDINDAMTGKFINELSLMILGCFLVYGILFGLVFIYGAYLYALIAVLWHFCSFVMMKLWQRNYTY